MSGFISLCGWAQQITRMHILKILDSYLILFCGNYFIFFFVKISF